MSIRTWWDTRSPWRIAARAQDRAARSAAQAVDIDRGFTAYVMWASVRIEELEYSATFAAREIADITDRLIDVRRVNRTLVAKEQTARDERDSARGVAVRLEQENAHLLAVVRSANTELCKAVMWAPAERMPELAAVLDVVDEALAGVHG